MVRMSATEVARNFSAAINRVGAGEEIVHAEIEDAKPEKQ